MARKRRLHILRRGIETGGVVDADAPDPVDVRELARRGSIGYVAPSENKLLPSLAHLTSLAHDVQNQGGVRVSSHRDHSVRRIARSLTAFAVRIPSNRVRIIDRLRQSERQIRRRVGLRRSCGIVLDRGSQARPRAAVRGEGKLTYM